MTHDQIRQKFVDFFNGQPNFMTPNIAGYFKHGKYIGEVSHSRESYYIFGKLTGITILEINDKGACKRPDGDDNLSFSISKYISLNEAKEIFIERLEEANNV